MISWGPSSSDESSSPRFSNCNCSCLSFSFAASISARWAVSLASFSLASFSAACFLRFSSCFLTLPCLTCSSSALSLACEAARSLASSSSWRWASPLLIMVRCSTTIRRQGNLLHVAGFGFLNPLLFLDLLFFAALLGFYSKCVFFGFSLGFSTLSRAICAAFA